MHRQRVIGSFVVILASLSTAGAATIHVPADYPTIAAAVQAAAAEDTIEVAAGLYQPAETIIIDKQLTIRGPQAGVDPRPSSDTTRVPGDLTTEAIVDGGGTLPTLLLLEADDIVIDGLEIRNAPGDMVASLAAAPVKHRPAIRYCIVHQATGDEGIQLRNTTDAVIEYNHVFDTAGDGINVCCNARNAVIRYNEVHEIYSSDAGIYIYQGDASAADLNVTVAGNLVYDILQNDGIKLGHTRGLDAALIGGMIVSNVIHDTLQDGITVYTSHTLVAGNDVSRSFSENGAIYLQFDIHDVVIINNAVHDNGPSVHDDLPGFCTPCAPGIIHGPTYGIRVGKCNPFPMANVVVTNNCLSGNVEGGLIFSVTDGQWVLDARGNWWGDASGPTHPANAGSSGDVVTDCVDYGGWLSRCPLGVLHVDIDIRPGSFPNPVNLGSNGVVPVAVFSTVSFDATTIDPTTVSLAGAGVRVKGNGTSLAVVRDVNKDGLPDLVVSVETDALQLTEGDTEAILEAETFDGLPVRGTDSIRVVP